MSLTDPTFIEKHLKLIKIIGVLLAALFVIGIALWGFSALSDWNYSRGLDKKKEAVNQAVQEISNIDAEIDRLNVNKAEKTGELKRDTEALMKEIYGREEVKKETNQAIANFANAVNSNSNVNRSAQDIQKLLEELEK